MIVRPPFTTDRWMVTTRHPLRSRKQQWHPSWSAALIVQDRARHAAADQRRNRPKRKTKK